MVKLLLSRRGNPLLREGQGWRPEEICWERGYGRVAAMLKRAGDAWAAKEVEEKDEVRCHALVWGSV